MQRATLELALASEAIYSQVLQPENLSHTSLVFGRSADEQRIRVGIEPVYRAGNNQKKHYSDAYPSIEEMRQDAQSLRNNFLQARKHAPRFETEVCHAIMEANEVGAVETKIRCIADLLDAGCQGADHLDILHCEVYCDSLPQVQRVWTSLRAKLQSEEQSVRIVALWDGFAQEEQKRCCRIIVSIDGYLATVVLLVSSLAEDFGGLRRRLPSAGSQRSMFCVKSFALQSSMALIRCVALLTAAFFACQYLARYAPRQLRDALPSQFVEFLKIQESEIVEDKTWWSDVECHLFVLALCKALPSQFVEFLKIQESEIVEDKTWWSAICLSLPYAVLVIVFAHDLFCHRLVRRLTLSQLIYERHFGIHGNHYVAKVAALQLVTVLLQAFGKLRLLGGIVIFGMEQQAAVQSFQLAFWCFFGLLLWNGLYPSLLFIFPNSTWCRYNSAMMDVILDLGYVLTYLAMVILGMSELSLKASAGGNFGDLEELKFSNSISPVFAFPSDTLQYLAVYVSVAHVCCACRAVERTAQGYGRTESKAKQNISFRWTSWSPIWCRRFFQACYTPSVVVILVMLLRSEEVYPGHSRNFTCFPCRCSESAMGLHLESCGLAAVLQQKQLVLTNLSSIEPEAFNQLGCHTTQMSLGNSSLAAMPSGRFKHLKCLKILDLGRAKLEELDADAFVGLEKLQLLSMSENLLTNLSAAHLSHLPTLHHLFLGGKTDKSGNLIVRGNSLQSLPSDLFQKNPQLQTFDISENSLKSFPNGLLDGLTALETFDLGYNELSQLPSEVFSGLRALKTLDLWGNKLSQLPSEAFSGLTALETLDLNGNQLSQLPSELPSEVFSGLTALKTLDLGYNKLSQLPSEVFSGLTALETLKLYSNKLSQVPSEAFSGLTALKTLYLSGNTFGSSLTRCVERNLSCVPCMRKGMGSHRRPQPLVCETDHLSIFGGVLNVPEVDRQNYQVISFERSNLGGGGGGDSQGDGVADGPLDQATGLPPLPLPCGLGSPHLTRNQTRCTDFKRQQTSRGLTENVAQVQLFFQDDADEPAEVHELHGCIADNFHPMSM
eukprot:symbB.v1.2.033617.t2/scaffold4203.1/size69029/4